MSEIATLVKEHLLGINNTLALTIQLIESATQAVNNSTGRLVATIEELRQESDGTAQRIVDAITAQSLLAASHS